MIHVNWHINYLPFLLLYHSTFFTVKNLRSLSLHFPFCFFILDALCSSGFSGLLSCPPASVIVLPVWLAPLSPFTASLWTFYTAFFFFFDTQISLIGRGGGNLGGGGSSGGGWSFHWTACWLTLLPESYGFITFGLEKGSIRRASDDSSALNASHTVPGACGCAVWLVKPDSPNVLLLSRRLPFLYSCCLLGLYFLFLFFSRLLPRGHYSLSSSSYYFYKHYYTVFSWIYTFHIFYPISPPGLSLYLNSA